jgi:non-ribosomal peptide synthetase component F
VAWLRALQLDQTECRRFDYLSLAQVQSCSDLPAGVNLFDSVVVFENYPIDATALDEAGLQVRELQAVDTTNFPLSLSAYLGDQLCFDLAYDPRLFDGGTIERMAEHLQMLLVRTGRWASCRC